VSAEEARDLVMAARVELGIVDAADVYEEEAEDTEEEEGAEATEDGTEEEETV